MEALKEKITKLEENYKKEKEKIHQVIEDLEKRDRQMVEQISQLNTITSPSSSAQPSTSPSDTPDHASSMLDFLNSFGNGLIPKCISSNTDTTAVQALIQTFTDHCAQLGHHVVHLKIQHQGQSQASGGVDASDQTGG
eukprot:272052-Karenia_brevis.AAC.1